MSRSVQEMVKRPAASAIRPFVDGYLGYRLVGFSPGLHRGLPSRHMTFIISIGNSIDVVAQSNPGQRPERYRCVLSGLQASPAIVAHDGNQEGIGIELTPLGSRALLGLPASEIWDLSLEFADVVGPVGNELWARLQEAEGWEERFTVCDEVLLRLARPAGVAHELQFSWESLIATQGRISVGDLASKIGYSRRHLTRLFRSEFGLTPKLAARVVRFEHAQRKLKSLRNAVPMAEVAASCGYYDQAHLYRDFADLGGCTPTEFFREEVLSLREESGRRTDRQPHSAVTGRS